MNKSINVIEVNNPQTYVCDLHRYEIGHSQLCVYAKRQGKFIHEDNVYVIFSNAIYFEGPFHWDGLSFAIGQQEECLQILQLINYPYRELTPNHFPNLYELIFNDLTIRIIANKVTVSKDVPKF
jgi:hypothetical protein